MKLNKLIIAFLIGTLGLQAQVERPKLVVGIVVDQMRMEYLYRFYNGFSENGFKRLMNQGFMYTNMHYTYVPTYTAPGHSSIFTGTTPYHHGIVGNEWFSRSQKKKVYCTDDASVTPLGNPYKAEEGLMSPKNLQATTVTDELKLSTNFKGKVIGISAKDRAAILPAGHFADRAYWLSDNGNFISSSFYGNTFPLWVENYNIEKRYMKYVNGGWNLLKDPSQYKESLPDDNPYEGIPSYATKAVFPYSFKKEYEKSGKVGFLKATPFGNDLLEDFAKEAILHEDLGKDEITDFLTLSFSSTDYIGHIIGPRSMELQDTYLRLDLTLADFLNFIDKQVGKGNYLVFLTADHACTENPNFMHDHGFEAANLNYKKLEADWKDFSVKTFGKDYVMNYSNQNLYLDEDVLTKDGLKLNEVEQKLIKYIESKEFVKRVYTEEELLNISPVDEYGAMIARGYDKTQNGQLFIQLKAGYMEYGPTGTTHGTSYAYDTHVPALFYGWKIPQGISKNKVLITEIAPTISQKINITIPNSSNGEVLSEILK